MEDTSNRRRNSRNAIKNDRAFGMLSIGNRQIPVLIINESIGGLGVVAVNAPEIETGTIARFESAIRQQESRIASIKYVKFTDAVVCRLGLEWTD
jgi:hypothetical protein